MELRSLWGSSLFEIVRWSGSRARRFHPVLPLTLTAKESTKSDNFLLFLDDSRLSELET